MTTSLRVREKESMRVCARCQISSTLTLSHSHTLPLFTAGARIPSRTRINGNPFPIHRIALAAVVVSLAGCSQHRSGPLNPPSVPIVWPKPPDAARIRYLGELQSSSDVRPAKSIGQVLDEVFHGPAKPIHLVSPRAVAVHADGDRVAIADPGIRCVHVFDLAGQVYQCVTSCAGEALGCPAAVLWVGESLFIADSEVHGVAISAGPAGERWLGRDILKRPAGLAYCSQNELLYVSDAAAHQVFTFDLQGRTAMQFGSHGTEAGQFNGPTQLACIGDVLAVVDSLNFRVQRFSLDGTPLGQFGAKGDASGDLALPKGVAVGPDGNLWVVDAHFENVQAFTQDGRLLLAFGQEGHKPGEFWLPAGACTDGKRRLWIADSYNRRVQVFEMLP